MLFRTRYNALFRQFRLLTAQAGSIPAAIRLIFENCYKLHLQQALHTTAGGWPHFREEVRTTRFTFTFHVGRKRITLGLVVKSKNRHPGR